MQEVITSLAYVDAISLAYMIPIASHLISPCYHFYGWSDVTDTIVFGFWSICRASSQWQLVWCGVCNRWKFSTAGRKGYCHPESSNQVTVLRMHL